VDLAAEEMLDLVPVEVDQMELQIVVVVEEEHQQMVHLIQHLLVVPVVPVSSSSLIHHKYLKTHYGVRDSCKSDTKPQWIKHRNLQ